MRGSVPERSGRVVLAWLAAVVIALTGHGPPHHHAGHHRHHRQHAAHTRRGSHRHRPRSVRRWPRYSQSWNREAACIRHYESGGKWSINTGNGYYGAYQFLYSTWRSVGGTTRPDLASPGEQTYRAHRVWARDGGSWREWGTAGVCGLR